MGRLEGKTALVTGASKGIGRAIAIGFAREGADVAIGYNTTNPAEVIEQIQSFGRRAEPIKMDITRKNEAIAGVEQAVGRMGRLDVLVNNAGIFPSVPFLELTEEDMDSVFSLNLRGTFFVTQAVLRHMLAAKNGSVINMSSAQALLGHAIMPQYTATKGAIVSMTRAWAAEFSPYGIRVNCICGGPVGTETLLGIVPGEVLETIVKGQAIPRIGQPEDFVGIAVYLAADESSWTTGAIIPVDGGTTSCYPLALGIPNFTE